MPTCTSSQPEIQATIPISVATLLPETTPGIALHLRDDNDDSFRLYRSAEHSITAADLDNLRSRGISKLYVAGDDHNDYHRYVRENLDRVLDDESVPAHRRLGCLNEVVRDVLGDV